MNTVVPISITTPDGIERHLRATLGARKRIAERFSESDISKVLIKHGDGAIGEILWLMLFDAKGKPPSIGIEELNEQLAPEDATLLLASILSAFSQGKTSPNEIETLMAEAVKMAAELEANRTGSTSGDSAGSVSELPTVTSGTDTSNAKLTLLPVTTESTTSELAAP